MGGVCISTFWRTCAASIACSGPIFPSAAISGRRVERMERIPQDLMAYLPPVPPGYAIGYYDGYCLVYDPYSLMIVGMIDLYEY
jgi:hypothetical protein